MARSRKPIAGNGSRLRLNADQAAIDSAQTSEDHGLSTFAARRVVTAGLRARVVSQIIGKLEPGFARFWLSDGAMGPVDVLGAVLEQTGPADVLVTTWTISPGEVSAAWRFIGDGRIRSVRFVVDASLLSREAAYMAALVARFGPDAVRPAKVHAKLITIVNDRWAVVLRGSANWTRAPRLEFYELSDDRGLADYIGRILSPLWDKPAAETEAESVREYSKWIGKLEEKGAGYLESGAFGRDVRRRGMSYI